MGIILKNANRAETPPMVRSEYHCLLLPLFNQFAFSLISESEPNIQVCGHVAACCGHRCPALLCSAV